MDWTPEIEDLVEKYLQQNLTGEELKEWQALMKVPQFRWYVEDIRKAREQVLNHENKISSASPKNSIGQRSCIVWGIAVLIAILMTVIIGLIFH